MVLGVSTFYFYLVLLPFTFLLLTFQCALHGVREVAQGGERLVEVGKRPEGEEALPRSSPVVVRGDDDDARLRMALPDSLQHFVPVHPRQLEVHEDDLRLVQLHELKAGGARQRDVDLAAPRAEELVERLRELRLIVNRHDPWLCHRSTEPLR